MSVSIFRRISACVLVSVAAASGFVLSAQAMPTFDQRVDAQRAIERVYWENRLWPGDPAARPSFGDRWPQEALAARVRDTLRKSQALETYWRHTLSNAELQAEVDRMARTTQAPDALARLFHTLDDDPGLIAETLARQTLADRLLRNWYSADPRFHDGVEAVARQALADSTQLDTWVARGGIVRDTTWAIDDMDDASWRAMLDQLRQRVGVNLRVGTWSALHEGRDAFTVIAVRELTAESLTVTSVSWPKQSFDDWWELEQDSFAATLPAATGSYAIPQTPSSLPVCDSQTWQSLSGVPVGRQRHAAVWTGAEMIVWGGGHGEPPSGTGFDTGSRYDPATDSWQRISTIGAPAGRIDHTLVWTGSEVVVWGGRVGDSETGASTATGGRYDPATDSWQVVTTAGAAQARQGHSAVWTGSEVIVWGGEQQAGGSTISLGDGGRYDPASDSWNAVAALDAPSARRAHTAVWTGSEMIVWGGTVSWTAYFDTGARYDPVADSWASMDTATETPLGRGYHSAVWTGNEMIVWGGITYQAGTTWLNTGARYDPATNSWSATSQQTVPKARRDHTAVWTGSEMIVWGGSGYVAQSTVDELQTGGVYDPVSDSWWLTDNSMAPRARTQHTAVWTGSEMVVWGGGDTDASIGIEYLETGARFDPATNVWTPTHSAGTPARRAHHTAVWTGAEMIVWGGSRYGDGYLSTGGRFDPATNIWTETSLGGAPEGRRDHSAVWTGDTMIVWGGYLVDTIVGAKKLDTGGRYDPATDSWAATTTSGAASKRWAHTAVWSGSEMLVWGGGSLSGAHQGGRYDPATDSWTPLSTAGSPDARYKHSALWTGDGMIVWGGGGEFDPRDSGGIYDPATDTWVATSLVDAPDPRLWPAAVWTGDEMIVWGGSGDGGPKLDSGGVYDPATDSWSATSSVGVPAASGRPTAVWTGSHMIVWGGWGDGDIDVNTGGAYHAATDTWTSTPPTAAPRGRASHTAVWTGMEMLVFGGEAQPVSFWGDGARLCAIDSDGDGAMNDQDCSAGDGSVWTAPGEISGLLLDGNGSTTLSWQTPADPGGATLTYDVLRAAQAEFGAPLCLAAGVQGTSADDHVDPDDNSVYFYLVRPENPCGSTAGAGSDGTARFADPCP